MVNVSSMPNKLLVFGIIQCVMPEQNPLEKMKYKIVRMEVEVKENKISCGVFRVKYFVKNFPYLPSLSQTL